MLKVWASFDSVVPLLLGKDGWALFPEPVSAGQTVELFVYDTVRNGLPVGTGEVIRCEVIRVTSQKSPTECEADLRRLA